MSSRLNWGSPSRDGTFASNSDLRFMKLGPRKSEKIPRELRGFCQIQSENDPKILVIIVNEELREFGIKWMKNKLSLAKLTSSPCLDSNSLNSLPSIPHHERTSIENKFSEKFCKTNDDIDKLRSEFINSLPNNLKSSLIFDIAARTKNNS